MEKRDKSRLQELRRRNVRAMNKMGEVSPEKKTKEEPSPIILKKDKAQINSTKKAEK